MTLRQLWPAKTARERSQRQLAFDVVSLFMASGKFSKEDFLAKGIIKEWRSDFRVQRNPGYTAAYHDAMEAKRAGKTWDIDSFLKQKGNGTNGNAK